MFNMSMSQSKRACDVGPLPKVPKDELQVLLKRYLAEVGEAFFFKTPKYDFIKGSSPPDCKGVLEIKAWLVLYLGKVPSARLAKAFVF